MGLRIFCSMAILRSSRQMTEQVTLFTRYSIVLFFVQIAEQVFQDPELFGS